MNSFQDCVCQPPLSPSCDCDPSSSTPDSSCPPDQRCLGNCKCQLCPQSGGQDRQGQKVLNPPLTFVVDTTKSVKPDKDSFFNLTSKVISSIRSEKINIPR